MRIWGYIAHSFHIMSPAPNQYFGYYIKKLCRTNCVIRQNNSYKLRTKGLSKKISEISWWKASDMNVNWTTLISLYQRCLMLWDILTFWEQNKNEYNIGCFIKCAIFRIFMLESCQFCFNYFCHLISLRFSRTILHYRNVWLYMYCMVSTWTFLGFNWTSRSNFCTKLRTVNVVGASTRQSVVRSFRKVTAKHSSFFLMTFSLIISWWLLNRFMTI